MAVELSVKLQVLATLTCSSPMDMFEAVVTGGGYIQIAQ